MDAKELRIGNLVDETGDIAVVALSTFKRWNELNLSMYLKPIPLTEEWLLKFGFENMDKYLNTKGQRVLGKFCIKYVEWIDSDPEYRLFKTGGGELIYYKHGEVPSIKFVHQLQNLYFALTGEELKLKEDEK